MSKNDRHAFQIFWDQYFEENKLDEFAQNIVCSNKNKEKNTYQVEIDGTKVVGGLQKCW